MHGKRFRGAVAVLDCEIAKARENYGGISKSIFSNMVTFAKFARTRERVTTDDIDIHHLDELELRKHHGLSGGAGA